MEIINHKERGQVISEIKADGVIITSTRDALDIMADVSYQGHSRIILYKENITPEFFDLKTGIAGEILQKFVNYGVKLAIIGDFSQYNSKSLNDFIKECNRGSQLFFAADFEEAKIKLCKGL